MNADVIALEHLTISYNIQCLWHSKFYPETVYLYQRMMLGHTLV